MIEKKFKKREDEIVTLVRGVGGCLASDRITVDGCPVGYMYREEPDHEFDSGWRIFAGDESQEYLNDPINSDYFHLNTIVNYDPEIIPFINAPAGSKLERDVAGKLVFIE